MPRGTFGLSKAEWTLYADCFEDEGKPVSISKRRQSSSANTVKFPDPNRKGVFGTRVSVPLTNTEVWTKTERWKDRRLKK